MKPSCHNKVVLITGASSGIGEATAWAFAKAGAKVVLAARRIERLERTVLDMQAQGLKAMAVLCDVTQAESMSAIMLQIHKTFGVLDIVIANAGFGVVGKVESLTVADFKRQFDTNVYGVLNTFYATLSDLKTTQGSFVIIGSVAGYISIPRTAPYSMSKFAVRALADSLYGECALDNVAVTLITPGYVKSEIRQINNLGLYQANLIDPIPGWLRIKSQKAAQAIVKATLNREREHIITFHAKLVLFLNWLLPGVIPRFMRLRFKFKNGKA